MRVYFVTFDFFYSFIGRQECCSPLSKHVPFILTFSQSSKSKACELIEHSRELPILTAPVGALRTGRGVAVVLPCQTFISHVHLCTFYVSFTLLMMCNFCIMNFNHILSSDVNSNNICPAKQFVGLIWLRLELGLALETNAVE